MLDQQTLHTDGGSAPCPICRMEASPRKAQLLHGTRVCRYCWRGFASARQMAVVADLIMLFLALVVLAPLRVRMANPDGLIHVLLLALLALFALKDGFRGMSPGKALFGVRVVDRCSLRPIGFRQSFLRNLPLPGLVGFSMCVPGLTTSPGSVMLSSGATVLFIGLLAIGGSLVRGPRLGDGLGHTKVVWDEYRNRSPFDLRARDERPGVL